MKKIMTMNLIAVFFLLSAFAGAGTEHSAKMNYYVGDVFIIKKDIRKLQKASINDKLYPGDRIETKGESRCEIVYNDGSVIRLDQFTIYKIEEKQKEKEEKSGDILSFGKIWANIIKFVSSGERHNVKTPTAVAAIRGTVYQVECDSVKSSYKVFEGGIDVLPIGLNDPDKATKFSINYGEEFTLVNNFEEYRKQQEKAFEDFQKQQEKAFEDYMKKDQAEFEEFKQKDLAEFQEFQNYHVMIDKFDIEEEKQKDEWVKWNMERDAALQR